MSGGGRGGRSVKDHGDARRLPNINTIPGGTSLHSNRNINGLNKMCYVFRHESSDQAHLLLLLTG